MEGRPKDESELFSRAQRGDTAAYEEIVQRYQLVAFRTAYVITGSAADAEEAAQDGFVKAYRALGTFRSGAEPRPWLLKIVANEANLPLFVYDRDGSLAGSLWYLHFRTAQQMADAAARDQERALGLREDRDGMHREMWLAVQKYISNHF